MANLERALPMTIAYYIASPTWGGGEQYVFDLARHMKAQYDVQPFFLFPAQSDAAMIARFAQIGEAAVFPYAGKIWRFSPFAGRQLAKLLDAHYTDILHINSRQIYFLAAWAKRHASHPFRLIATQHLARPAKTGVLWRWIYRQIDSLLCVSQLVRETYLRPLKGDTCFQDVHVVYNSVPVRREEATAQKPDATLPRLLFHGRICREKGIEPLFQALSQIKDLPFRITFAGNIAAEDQALWERLLSTSPVRDRIDYIGFREDIRSLMRTCDIGVSPSLAREAGSLSLMDDMSMGLAIITTSSGSQPEIIQHGHNGLLCPPNDPQALADALRSLLTDPELRRRLGQQAQDDFFAHYTYEAFLESMYHFYAPAAC